MIEVESHVEIDQNFTVVEANDIESDLRKQAREIEPVSDVHIHLDPAGHGKWKDADD